MKIRVRFFAMCRELAGTDRAAFEFPDNADKHYLLNEITGSYRGLSGILSRVALAVNNKYISGDFELHDGDEISLIPPVSGG